MTILFPTQSTYSIENYLRAGFLSGLLILCQPGVLIARLCVSETLGLSYSVHHLCVPSFHTSLCQPGVFIAGLCVRGDPGIKLFQCIIYVYQVFILLYSFLVKKCTGIFTICKIIDQLPFPGYRIVMYACRQVIGFLKNEFCRMTFFSIKAVSANTSHIVQPGTAWSHVLYSTGINFAFFSSH